MREPYAAVGIDDHVVRLDFLPRQVVLGDDDACGTPGRARRDLELEAVHGLGAEVER
jgi:hypothetical protein